jgi:hypothetical protein
MSYIVSYKEPDRAVPEAGPGAVPGDFMSCSWWTKWHGTGFLPIFAINYYPASAAITSPWDML